MTDGQQHLNQMDEEKETNTDQSEKTQGEQIVPRPVEDQTNTLQAEQSVITEDNAQETEQDAPQDELNKPLPVSNNELSEIDQDGQSDREVMDVTHTEEELNQFIEELCHSKAEEFRMLGYEHVEGKEIWECVSSAYKDGTPALHRIVNDILSLKVTKFMNWMTMSIYQTE